MKSNYLRLIAIISLLCSTAFANNLGVLATVHIEGARENLEITFKNSDLGEDHQATNSSKNSDFICSVEYQVDLLNKDSYRAVVLGHRVQIQDVLIPYGESIKFNINPRVGFPNTIIDDVGIHRSLKCSYSTKSLKTEQSEAALNSLAMLLKNNQALEAKDFLGKYNNLINGTKHAYIDLGNSDYSPETYSHFKELKSLLSSVQYFNVNDTPFFSLALDKELNGKSCMTSQNVICGFVYKSKRSKFCVEKEPKYGNGKPCGALRFNKRSHSLCGKKSSEWYADNSCAYGPSRDVYKTGRHSSCGCQKRERGFGRCINGCGCKKYKSCRYKSHSEKSRTKCKERNIVWNSCERKEFGVAEYKSCRNKEFGMEYISCRNNKHGAESVNSCDIKVDEDNKLSVGIEGCQN